MLVSLLYTFLYRGTTNAPADPLQLTPSWKHLIKLLLKLSNASALLFGRQGPVTDEDLHTLNREQLRARKPINITLSRNDLSSSDDDLQDLGKEVIRNLVAICVEKSKLTPGVPVFGEQLTPGDSIQGCEQEGQLHVLVALLRQHYDFIGEKIDSVQKLYARAARDANDAGDDANPQPNTLTRALVKPAKRSAAAINTALFIVEHALHLLCEHVALYLSTKTTSAKHAYVEQCQLLKELLLKIEEKKPKDKDRGAGQPSTVTALAVPLRLGVPQTDFKQEALSVRLARHMERLGYPASYAKDRFTFINFRIRKLLKSLDLDAAPANLMGVYG